MGAKQTIRPADSIVSRWHVPVDEKDGHNHGLLEGQYKRAGGDEQNGSAPETGRHNWARPPALVWALPQEPRGGSVPSCPQAARKLHRKPVTLTWQMWMMNSGCRSPGILIFPL